MAGSKANRHASKTDTLIRTVEQSRQARGLDRHRIIPRVSQLPSGGGNNPAGGAHVGASGNFLDPTGDTMIGPIAFFPQVTSIDTSDPLNPSIDVGINSGNYTTSLFVSGFDNDLRTIFNASFQGQLLYLQWTGGGVLTLKQGDGTDGGNIVTNTGGDLVVNFGEVVTFLFTQTGGADPTVNGEWRVVTAGVGSGGGTAGNAKTGFMLTSTGSTQVVASAATDILDVFDITVIQDGVTVNTTTNIITIQETGRYIFGLNLTLAADVNNTTADFALVVNGTPLTNVNSVFLRGFGDNDGLYPAAPSDFNAGDTLEISISHDKGVSVTFTFQECGFYLIKQESGGGNGTGGVTQLGDLSDVDFPTAIINDQVLTFNGTTSLWENKAFPTGGMNTDLSNMSDPTVPTVDLKMNNQSVREVLFLDFDGFGGIQGLSNLDWNQTNQSITSLSQGLVYLVDSLQSHTFTVGGVGGIEVIGQGGGVVALELFNNSIDDVKDINFDSNGTAVIQDTTAGIGLATLGATLFMKYNTGATDQSHVFSLAGSTRLSVNLGGINVVGTTDTDILQLALGGSESFIAGRMRQDGTDVFIFSGGEERNITNVVAGDFNKISQGNSSVTVIDTGTGSITDIIDGGVVSTKDATNFAISQNVSFGSNTLTGLGNTSPASTGILDMGGATLFWNNVFTNRVRLGDLNNTIQADGTFGINYEVSTTRNHDFLIAGNTRFRVTNDLVTVNLVDLDLTQQNIINLGELNMISSNSAINMSGGDINNAGDISLTKRLNFSDIAGNPTTGQMQRSGDDILVSTTNGIKNMKDIGAATGSSDRIESPDGQTTVQARNVNVITRVAGNDILVLQSLNSTAFLNNNLQMGGRTIFMTNGPIAQVSTLTMNSSSSILNMLGGDITNAGSIEIEDTLEHQGNAAGFFGQQTTIRRLVNNPASTSNNDLFASLNDLINALGTLNGFGLGLVDTGN